MDTIPGFEVVRATPDAVRAEPVDDGAMPTMDVRFSPFGTWYEINSMWEGNFLERTEQGAFKKTMAENRGNVRVLFNHGFDPQIGQKVLGSIADMREDSDAAAGVVDLFDTSYVRDLLPGLKAGVYGSSMRMVVVKDEINQDPGVSEHNPKGLPERTIKEVRLMEFGPVTFPANPEATAGVRSMTDQFYEQLRAIDPSRVDAVARSIQARTPQDPPAGSTTGAPDGAARTTTTEPPVGHSSGMTPSQRRERLLSLTEGA